MAWCRARGPWTASPHPCATWVLIYKLPYIITWDFIRYIVYPSDSNRFVRGRAHLEGTTADQHGVVGVAQATVMWAWMMPGSSVANTEPPSTRITRKPVPLLSIAPGAYIVFAVPHHMCSIVSWYWRSTGYNGRGGHSTIACTSKLYGKWSRHCNFRTIRWTKGACFINHACHRSIRYDKMRLPRCGVTIDTTLSPQD